MERVNSGAVQIDHSVCESIIIIINIPRDMECQPTYYQHLPWSLCQLTDAAFLFVTFFPQLCEHDLCNCTTNLSEWNTALKTMDPYKHWSDTFKCYIDHIFK